MGAVLVSILIDMDGLHSIPRGIIFLEMRKGKI